MIYALLAVMFSIFVVMVVYVDRHYKQGKKDDEEMDRLAKELGED